MIYRSDRTFTSELKVYYESSRQDKQLIRVFRHEVDLYRFTRQLFNERMKKLNLNRWELENNEL